MTMTGTEALARIMARREARAAALTWTKGEGGLFTGSESDGSTHKAHRSGEPHTDARIFRAINEGIEALKNSSVTARVMEFTDKAGNSRNMEVSNVRETSRPDTMHSEVVPTIQQAADAPNGMELDRPIVVNGWAADIRVLPDATGEKRSPDYPGMTRDISGGTAMMGAAEDTKAPAAAPAPAKPVVVQAPPAQPAQPDQAKIARDLADNAERDQRIADLESDVKKLRTELDGIEALGVDDALSEMDTWTSEGGEAAMPQSMIAAVGARYALPTAFVESTVAAVALPDAMVAAVDAKHQLPAYTPGAFTAGAYTKGEGGLFTGSEPGGGTEHATHGDANGRQIHEGDTVMLDDGVEGYVTALGPDSGGVGLVEVDIPEMGTSDRFDSDSLTVKPDEVPGYHTGIGHALPGMGR
jgi:hypothetical protein